MVVEGVENPLPLELGTDLTQWIGIKKYEEPETGVNIGGKVGAVVSHVSMSLFVISPFPPFWKRSL